MEYKKYEFDGYTVHFLKSDKFKSIYISTVLINGFKKENLTKNFILRKLLVTSSKNLKNEVEVARKVSELYGAGIAVSNDVLGNVITTSFDMEVLEDKYTEDGLFKNALNYYFDTIFYPNIVDGKFEKNNYNIVMNNAKVYYESEKENKDKYAYDNAFLLVDEEVLKYNRSGYAEDLKDITRENIVTYYNDLIDKANVNIFMIGSFNDEEILKILNDNIGNKFKSNKNIYKKLEFSKKPEIKTKEDIEKNNQSILILIYKALNITDRESKVIVPVFNRIFGGSNNSKLFKTVREKNSLCYNIRSSISSSGLITVESGISHENKDQAIELINEELENMKNGYITDEEFNEAINFRRKSLKQFEDYGDSLLYIKAGNVLFGSDDLDERLEKLSTIKKEEIVEFAKKIELNVVYMLKGENKNGKN